MKIFCIIFLPIIYLSGCASYTRDVSNNEDLWGGYKYNVEYQLLVDVFLLKVDADIGNEHMALAPEEDLAQDGFYETPHSIKDYIKNGSIDDSMDVIGIVQSGTVIKAVLLKNTKDYSAWYGFISGNTIFAKIQNGKFKDTIVDLHDISLLYRDKDVVKFKPNPRLLESVRNE